MPSRQQEKGKAVIGPSIRIHGELNGDEDLIIEGQVDGKVDLKKNNVTVGRNGRVKADVYGKIIHIEGHVEGNLFGEEKIVLHERGSVRGNLSAPRVNLEDGAKFKGSIDMDSATKPSVSKEDTSQSKMTASPSKSSGEEKDSKASKSESKVHGSR